MKNLLSFLDEMLFAILLWPVTIWGTFKILVDFLRMPSNWYTFFATLIISMYIAVKVDSKGN
jgi:hypothetical protein